jgi:hypothetical protein
VSDYWKGDDDILHANAEFSEVESADSEPIPLENQFDGLSVLLRKLENHPMVEKKKLVVDYDNLWDSRLAPQRVDSNKSRGKAKTSGNR